MRLFQVSSYFLFLCATISLFGKCANNRIFNEGDHLLPGFDIEGLEVFDEYTRQNLDCPEVIEKVRVHRYWCLQSILHQVIDNL